MNLEIYVATHKKFQENLPEFYKPILVGSYNKDINDYIRDDIGEKQISNKNENYCELTGLYWIWKNVNTDYIGLCHYRRYFKGKKHKFIDKEEVEEILKKYDIILPTRWIYLKTVYDDYEKNHYIKDLILCKQIIEKRYPEYVENFNRVMDRNYMFLYNMFICKKEIIDQYFEWLFSILGELENIVDISEYDQYQKRIYGFLSERLFNVWLDNQKYNIKEIDVIKIGESNLKQFMVRRKNTIKKIIGGVKRK